MLGLINKAFESKDNAVSQKKPALIQEQKAARLKEVNHILSNIAMAGIKGKSNMIEDHSDKNIDSLIVEKQQLESDLEISNS